MAHVDVVGARSAKRVALLLCTFALTCAGRAHARSGAPTTVAQMAVSAARVFRGHCTAAVTGTVEVAGARLAVTTYTFRVAEHLKGGRRRTVTFRQLGSRDGGPGDLGRLAELPAYTPGTEYVLFLLPASTAGLTSPAGAAEGAFVLRDGEVLSARGATRGPSGAGGGRGRPAAPDLESSSYDELRRTVRDAVGP